MPEIELTLDVMTNEQLLTEYTKFISVCSIKATARIAQAQQKLNRQARRIAAKLPSTSSKAVQLEPQEELRYQEFSREFMRRMH